MEEPSPDDLAAMAFTERELFSLYAQYPEIDFDPESTQKLPETSSEHFSSPASNTGERDEAASAQASNSTRHTTPLKHDILNTNASDGDEYTVFCRQLRRCDLPPQAVQSLDSIGARFVQLGQAIMSGGRQSSIATEISSSLLPQLQHSAYKIKEQIDTIDYITELAAFNISPTDISLWSNYRQRASLITKHLSCPSQTELKLLTQLLRVFDGYVYNPYLHLKAQDTLPINLRVENKINTLYDALMTLLSTYQRCCRAMQSFKARYMIPIMRRIQDSPWIQREIEQVESALEAAQQALSTGEGNIAGLKLHEDQVKAAAKVVERRAKSSGSKIPAKTKTRFKREHTI